MRFRGSVAPLRTAHRPMAAFTSRFSPARASARSRGGSNRLRTVWERGTSGEAIRCIRSAAAPGR
jgi:hypothetical protein